MSGIRTRWGWFLLIAMGGVFPFFGNCANAQITPDSTLPNNSNITQVGNTSVIDAGTQAGRNLFHSFKEFSVPTGGTAFFNNAVDIQNIISRVTGGSVSNIDGLIRANGTANLFLINPNGIIFGQNARLNIGGSFIGSTASSLKFADGFEFSATNPQAAPLLTISVPTGLQYGANPGSIQVRGDGQGRRFITNPYETKLTTDGIDTTNALQVQQNQTLALVGGDIGLEGATLKTAGGRIELGSVGDNSLVSLTPINKGFALGYDSVQNFRNIQLSQQTAVDASGAGAGDIQVWGKRVTLTNGSQIEASTLGAESGGSLVMNATESIEVIGRSANNQFSSGLFTNANQGATGSAGSLAITTKTLLLQDGARVTTMTNGAGNGGNLTVNADTVELIGGSGDVEPPSGYLVVDSRLSTQSDFGATGNTGDLTINTRELLIRDGASVIIWDGASVRASNQRKGGNLTVNATDKVQLSGESPIGGWSSGLRIGTQNGTKGGGNLTINTRELLIQDGASVGASTFSAGKGGNLIVNATDKVQLSGIGSFFSSWLSTNSGMFASGEAGDIIINTRELLVQDGGQIVASSWNIGKGGNLTVNATDRVQLSGTDGTFSGGGLFTDSHSRGDAGDLTINTRELFIRDGAQVGATASSTGNAGNLTVNATDRVELSGSTASGRFSSNLSVSILQPRYPEFPFFSKATGTAGNLTINTRELLVRDGTGVFVRNQGTGNAGNLEVNARSISLDNQGQINAQSASGNGGNITLQVGDLLLLRRESQISATAGTARQPGNGGNITINAPDGFIVANRGENSDITANAFDGQGGKITIKATGIFGIAPLSRQELERLSPNDLDPSKLQTNDITAISQTNPSLSGTVQLIIPDVDVNRGLVELPVNLVDISQQIDTGCNPGSKQRRSSFVITGRGGLPPSPSDMLTPDAVLVDLITLNPNIDNRKSPSVTTKPTTNAPERIVEATGWVRNSKGEVVLTANPPTTTPHESWQKPVSCRAS